jgi:PAS domain-containing protein
MNLQSTPGSYGDVSSLVRDGWDNPDAGLIEQLPVAAYACDSAGRILWFNTQASELWGRVPASVTAANSIVDPTDFSLTAG